MFFRVLLLKNFFENVNFENYLVFLNLLILVIFFLNLNIKIGFSLLCIKCVMILGFRIKVLWINFENSIINLFFR